MSVIEVKKEVTILFAGDSGDGTQLTGNQFTNTNALFGNDISTFPDYPAEIRAPQGTVAGVSGFQLHFGSIDLFTPGDESDVLVAMNAAALKANLNKLKRAGIIIVNTSGFDKRNLTLAGIDVQDNPLTNGSLNSYTIYEIDITKITRAALVDSGLGTKDMDRCKNMFILGFLYWMYNRSIEHTIIFLRDKFKGNESILEANIKVLKVGYNFGDTSETFTSRYKVEKAPLAGGTYRNIMGNQALAIGLIAGAKKAGLDLFYGSYPITPASDILHALSKHKNFGVKTFQAEDEIAAICAAIGASYAGNIGMTASSGPGIALKGEAMGLAMMMELPLVVVSVQRGGPSTGLPTKTEQSDLNQALFGRSGEAPIPVIAAKSPTDCFEIAYEAVRIAIEHMTPVILLSDGYIANGSEPWKFPKQVDLKPIVPKRAKASNETYLPYLRDEKGVREWAIPGDEGLQHRLGGLEKQENTGNISYESENHHRMVKARQAKVDKIADDYAKLEIEVGKEKGTVLVLGWGSTFGVIKTSVRDLIEDGYSVSQLHITNIYPLPNDLKEITSKFDKILVPEMNNGQLVRILRAELHREIFGFNKIKGIPITSNEIKNEVIKVISE